MGSLTAALMREGTEESLALASSLVANPAIEQVVLIAGRDLSGQVAAQGESNKVRLVESESILGPDIAMLLDSITTDYLLLVLPGEQARLGHRAIERFISIADDCGAGILYSDFKDEHDGQPIDHPLIDYQPGSIRDGFDFGSMVLISKRAASSALERFGRIDKRLRWGGWYDLRLKLSITSAIQRIPEPLYTRIPIDKRASGERQFDYVDPRKRAYQDEMEFVASEHLKRAGAYLWPEFHSTPRSREPFPLRASIVIPVRNRERTIKDAVLSALSQQAGFNFNVIVVDNHSTDKTTEILSELAGKDSRLIHIKPVRADLGIGGCWNEAIFSSHCGEYAVQLDSDDLFRDERTLEKIMAKLEEGNYAMVIGAYTIVNFDLQEMPPGLIDHSEWTRDNGRNNALRINGLGAPRAYYVPVLRQVGFPNTSYGEDYSVALRISRHFEIGRIFESIYYARRWEGNSDAALPIATANRYDAYKDYLRTVEILARKRMNHK